MVNLNKVNADLEKSKKVDINNNINKEQVKGDTSFEEIETMSFDGKNGNVQATAKSLVVEGECPLILGPVGITFGGTLRIGSVSVDYDTVRKCDSSYGEVIEYIRDGKIVATKYLETGAWIVGEVLYTENGDVAYKLESAGMYTDGTYVYGRNGKYLSLVWDSNPSGFYYEGHYYKITKSKIISGGVEITTDNNRITQIYSVSDISKKCTLFGSKEKTTDGYKVVVKTTNHLLSIIKYYDINEKLVKTIKKEEKRETKNKGTENEYLVITTITTTYDENDREISRSESTEIR